MKSTGGASVMASRAPTVVETDSEQTRLYRALEFFPTPPWAARAGAELLLRLDPNCGCVWEPACGQGHMAEALREYLPDVFASDVYPHGYGEVLDFQDEATTGPADCDWVFTNPPFKTASQFVRLGLARARRGVILLLRLSFLESIERHALLYGDQPLTFCAPFAERVPMTLGRWSPDADTATAYAYFVWEKTGASPAGLLGIPPGTRDRLSRPDDAERFGWRAPLPLFEAAE